MRAASLVILQQYSPWPGALGLTLSLEKLSVPAPGQCLLLARENSLRLLPRIGMPSSYDAYANTVDVLLRDKANDARDWDTAKRGDSVGVIGPVGRPFHIDRQVRRALLIDDGSAVAPLLFLVNNLLEHGIEITFVSVDGGVVETAPASALPPEIEYVRVEVGAGLDVRVQMARELERLLPWADALYLALDVELYTTVLAIMRRGLLRLRKGFAQALCQPSVIPCGTGACDLCIVATRDGYRRSCRDGLVFDLLSLA